ncbi:MAG TPA: SCO family protein [Pirellulales bacterium]|jgi:protein SCO1/2|nr:SCO family protein [Pirellulales bacterium]
MKHSALIFWVTVLVFGTISYGGFKLLQLRSTTAAADDKTKDEVAPKKVVPFTLTDQDGNDWSSKSLDGQVWVASYFFASCPQICFQLNQELAKLQQDPQFAQVKFVSITCDPENDLPAVLKEYAKKFSADHSRWVFLTGDLKKVQQIGLDLQITVLKQTHSDRLVIVDPSGVIRGRFRATAPDQLELTKKTLLSVLAESKNLATKTNPTAETKAP